MSSSVEPTLVVDRLKWGMKGLCDVYISAIQPYSDWHAT